MTDIGSGQLSSSVPDIPDNPYVGPRAFRQGELFFGREYETQALLNTLIAGRIVLLHSPSGAGKTSLLQASLVPQMRDRGFQICARTQPRFSAIRVNNPPPAEFRGNPYVYSTVMSLYGRQVEDPSALWNWTICETLDRLEDLSNSAQQLLVFDQFEEILTVDPTDLEGQQEFFRQVGEALDTSHRWAVFAMREDFMGGLDRFLRYVPGQLRSTFRLDALDSEAALRAIQEPAARRNVEFVPEAARELVRDLRMVRIDSPYGSPVEHQGNFVEPVLLQVVCDNLWRKLAQDQGTSFSRITLSDVDDFKPLDMALARYYRRAIRKAANKDDFAERILRDWVQEKLLTKQGLRGQTTTKPQVENPDEALSIMQERYLIRVDPRPNGEWYELSHDRLVGAVIDDNQSWRERKLSPWQLSAYRWHRDRNGNQHLLSASELRAAHLLIRKDTPLTEVDEKFLSESQEKVNQDRERVNLTERLDRMKARSDLVLVLLFLSVGVNIALVLLRLAGK